MMRKLIVILLALCVALLAACAAKDGKKDGETTAGESGSEAQSTNNELVWDESDTALGPEFTSIYQSFNEEYDYDCDGDVGDEGDFADYEKYYKPFADEFDGTVDYDNDGVVDGDDLYWYNYVRSN